MKEIVLNQNIDLFPRPTGIQEYVVAHPGASAVQMGLEQGLALNANENGALIFGSLVEPQLASVTAVREDIHKDWPKGAPRIPRLQILRRYEAASNLGLVDYDSQADTVASRPGTEAVFALSNHLLNVSDESGTSLSVLLGTHHGGFDTETFGNLQHVRRLLMCMRIAKAGTTGVTIPRLESEGEAFSSIGRRSLQRIIDKMEERNAVKTKRISGISTRVWARPGLVEARHSLIRVFHMLDMDPIGFIDSAPDQRERLRPKFSALYERSIERTEG